MLPNQPDSRTISIIHAFALITLTLAGCETNRVRPTGPEGTVQTTVEVLTPPPLGVVPADSFTTVVVRATGLVQAVEYALITNARRELISSERLEIDPPVTEISVDFSVPIPAFASGTNLEVQGFAEDILGTLHSSEPVFVTVIECDGLTPACGQ